ncbi:MAG: amino acid permease [bacterium]|nr:amino acid permease [bacterium]
MSNIHNLNLAFSMFVFFLGIEIAAGYGRDILKPNKYPRVILISSVLIFIILILTILSISIMLNEKTGYFAIDLNIILTKLFPDYNLYLFIRIFLLVFGIGTLGCMSTWITAASKGFVYVFEENSLLCWFSKKNKNDVPFRLLILQAVIITLLCLSFALQSTIYLADVMLSQFVMQMYLIVYIIVFISAIKLRYRYPDIPRPFKIPFGNVGIWILGVIGIIGSCIAILTGFYLPLQLTGKNYPLIVAVFFVLIILIVLILPAIIYSKNIKLLIFDKSDNSNNKEYKIALTLVVLGIAAYFVKYFLNIILTRHLGAHEYGDLAVFLKLVVILSLLILVGTNNSAKKYLSKYFNKRDINNSIDFIKWNFHIVYKAFIIYILFLFVLYILMGVLHVLNIKDFFSHHYVFYYISVVPLASVAVLFSSYILSNKWPVLFFFFRKIAVFVVMLILIGGGILFYNVKINLNNIGIFLLVSYIIVIVAELVFISRISTEHNIFSGSIDFKGKVKKSKERKQWLSDSFRMIGSQLIFNLIWAIDLFILEGIHHSEHDVGYYAAMLVLINILLITPSAITTLLIPRITHFVSEKKFGELQNNINLINLMNIAILTILLILLLVFSETLLLFFGKGYNSAEIPFIILCFTYYIASVFVPAGKVLTFVETGLQFKVSVIELIIVIILGVVFTWFWGLTGIAVSVMISILFKSLCTYIILKRKLPIKPFTLF